MTAGRLWALLLFLLLVGMAARPATDPDLGWHLRTGEWILEHGKVPTADPFSFTNAGRAWVTHEWLSEVAMIGLFRLGGYPALIAAFAGVIGAAFLILYLRCDWPRPVAAVLTVWGALATSTLWGARPQMIAMLLASVLLYRLDRYRAVGNDGLAAARRSLFVIPVLVVLWVNLHGSYALAPVLVGLYAGGAALDGLTGQVEAARARRQFIALSLTALACVAAVPLNPHGFAMFGYPIETLRSGAQQSLITEWLSPDFHSANFRGLMALILAAAVGLAARARRLPASELLLIAAGLGAALTSRRHAPIFVLLAVPVISRQIGAELGGFAGRLRMPSPPRAVLAILVLAASGAAAWRVVEVAKGQAAAEAQEFPVKAVAFLRDRPQPQPMYNNYDWGGYLIWNAFPQYRVFVDGRADMYGDDFVYEAVGLHRGSAKWQEVLDRHRIRTVFVLPRSALATILREQSQWSVAFEDKQAAVFTREAP